MNGKRRAQAPAASADVSGLLHRALALYRGGTLEEAERLCRQALAMQPRNPDALNFAGVIAVGLGKTRRGIKYLKAATRALPDWDQAHYNLGTAYQAAGKLPAAVAAHRRAIAITPGYADAHYNLGNVLVRLGRIEDAVGAYAAALEADAAYPGAQVNMANALLRLGRAAPALAACDACLAADPGNRDAMTFKGVALGELGEGEAVRALLGFERLLRPFRFPPPQGFASMADFNDALAQHVCAHPSIVYEPANKATRRGQQTENLLAGARGPVAHLEAMMRRAVGEYTAALPRDAGHPFLANLPPLTQFDAWGTVLDNGGHQFPHTHRAAWISGVYYVRVPTTIAAEDPARAGWIEFGRNPPEFKCTVEPEIKAFCPEEGLMILFPSYVYHGTVPFQGSAQRISIAFDAMA